MSAITPLIVRSDHPSELEISRMAAPSASMRSTCRLRRSKSDVIACESMVRRPTAAARTALTSCSAARVRRERIAYTFWPTAGAHASTLSLTHATSGQVGRAASSTAAETTATSNDDGASMEPSS